MHCFMTVSTCMPLGAPNFFGNKVYCIVLYCIVFRLRKVTTHLDIDSAVDCPITLVVISTPIDFMLSLWLYCKGNRSESSL